MKHSPPAAALAALLALTTAAALAGCRRPATQTRIVEERVDPAALAAEPRTREDSLRRGAIRRADSIGARVDTIVVSPASLRLRVGDSVRYFELLRLEARDGAGAVVRGYAPIFHVQPSTVAGLRRGGFLVALAPGEATLLVRPVRFPDDAPATPRRPVTRVPLVVEPR